MKTQPTRRAVLGAIGGGLVVGTFATTAAAKSDVLAHQLDAARAATRRYRDLEQALDDDYVIASPFIPGMGFHFIKYSLVGSENVEEPAILVYFTTGSYEPAPFEAFDPERGDELRLGAVEYIMPGDQTVSPPNLFADETSTRRLKVSEDEGWVYIHELDITGLHAWVHRGNPAGVFHPTNPTID